MATLTTTRTGTATAPPFSYIQRFAIVHLSLPESSTGSALDEGAGIAELAESILYYYYCCNSEQQQQQQAEAADSQQLRDAKNHHWQRAAVRLGGLATAFWSLPRALTMTTTTPRDNNDNNRRAQQHQQQQQQQPSFQFIRLTNAALLLVQVEPDILCIVQFGTTARVTASAMATAVQRHYRLFCITAGGRIHSQLLSLMCNSQECNSNSYDDNDDDTAGRILYPGMKKLFQLLRQQRQLLHSSSNNNKDKQQQLLLQEELEAYRSTLPITRLRCRLAEHFDALVHEWQALRHVNPAAGRCILHGTPVLLPLGGSSNMGRAVPQQQSDKGDSCVDWKGILESLWQQHHDGPTNAAILGVSIFVQGHFQETITNHVATKTAGATIAHDIVDVETACLIMHYISSIRQELPAEHHEPAAAGFLRRTLGGLLPTATANNSNTEQAGSYLKPPPLSMLSATVQEIPSCMVGPPDDDGKEQQQMVWTPCLTLNGSFAPQQDVLVRACLYNRFGCDFVIYLDPAKEQDFSDSLWRFAAHIGQHVESTSAPASHIAVEKWDRVGQDILWIDRPRQRTIFYSSSSSSRRHPPKPGQSQRQRSTLEEVERQQLASRLSLDTLLALDEAMQHAQKTPRYEMCTLLRHNWLVCHARHGRELYVILDVKRYVTIQDVTVAMEEIEKYFGNEHDQPQ